MYTCTAFVSGVVSNYRRCRGVPCSGLHSYRSVIAKTLGCRLLRLTRVSDSDCSLEVASSWLQTFACGIEPRETPLRDVKPVLHTLLDYLKVCKLQIDVLCMYNAAILVSNV